MERYYHAVLTIFLILLVCSLSKRVDAVEYTIGAGVGLNDYPNLDALFTAIPTLASGDIITLYKNDSSLQNQIVVVPDGGTVTIRSDHPAAPWTISMNDPGAPFMSTGTMEIQGTNLTLILDGVIFSGGTATDDWYAFGGAIYTPGTVTFGGTGTSTFENNLSVFAGGAIYAESPATFDIAGTYLFKNNTADFYGGAILGFQSLAFDGAGTYIFEQNSAGVEGGAIYVHRSTLSFDGTGIYYFDQNSAVDNGGAISVRSSLSFDGTGTYTFGNNTAGVNGGAIFTDWGALSFDGTGGTYTFYKNSVTGDLSAGGAIFAGGGLSFAGAGTWRFEQNSATGSGSNGGAIYSSGILDFTGGGEYAFTGNQATRSGGAIYAATTLNFSNGGNYTFTGNQASGSGGAIYTNSNLLINTGATFTDNTAGNLGGAIYFDAFDASNHLTIKALDTTNGAVLFEGNTMNPSGTEIPNSIYFANTTSTNRTVTASFDVEQDAKFHMLDPMASQQNYLTVNLTKTGDGTWVLGGVNDMQSASTWNINAGKLFLVYNDYKKDGVLTPAHIKLGHATTAAFNLASGAVLVVEPGDNDPHWITGRNITLAAGSTSEVAGFKYGPELDLDHYVLLKLDAPNVSNGQAKTQSASGTITVGAYDYEYENLEWEDDDMTELAFTITKKTKNPVITGGDPGGGGRRRIGPISAPGHIAIGMSNHNLNIFERRSKNMFGSCRGNALGMSARNDLWGTQAFLSATHAQDGDYRMETPTVAFGYDRRLSRRTFVGIGAALGWPDFSSERTRIKADDSTLALYGGTKTRSGIELTGRAGLGSTSYRQTRNVRDEYHASRFGSHSFFTGLGVSKLLSTGSPGFCLRPGVNYDYIRLMMDGFHEDGGGLYALHFDKYSQDLHRLKVGLDLNWQPRRWFNATGEIFYLGMYGRSPKAHAWLVNDPVNDFTTTGSALDQNNLGLGLQLTLPLNRWEFGGGYTTLVARDTTSQQATLTVVYRF